MKKFVTVKVDSEVKDMASQVGHLIHRKGLLLVPKDLVRCYENEFGPIRRLSNNAIFGLSLLALRSRMGK